MSEQQNVITIDGPAGSGKSTVAKVMARRLGWDYIDTGAMYRCICLKALKRGHRLNDEETLVELVKNTTMRMRFDGSGLKVFMDGENVSQAIRRNRVNKHVSEVAALPMIREQLVEKQRALGEEGEVIMDGRDVGTVIFPAAKYKFYLDASLDIRAQRRDNELQDAREEVSLDVVVEEIKARDATDRGRSSGPLKPADDAWIIDTSEFTIEEVVDEMLKIFNRCRKND